MSSLADDGDTIEVTFTTTPGSDVEVLWLDHNQATVAQDTLTENPAGQYTTTFQLDGAGLWTARFINHTVGDTEDFHVRARALTGPPPLAVLGDVLELKPGLTVAQQALTVALIRRASALLRSTFPRIDERIAAGRLDPEVAALAVTNMVLRVLNNPNGLRAETTGPFSRTYDTTAAAGLLVVSASETGQIEPVTPTSGRGAIGTARITPGLIPTVRRTGYGVFWCD